MESELGLPGWLDRASKGSSGITPTTTDRLKHKGTTPQGAPPPKRAINANREARARTSLFLLA
eukprot:1158148-Pelagomonas_calceolata.AAC.5